MTSVAEWHSSKLVVVPVQLAARDCSGGVGSWCRSGIIGLSTVSSISICKLKARRESMNNAVIHQREKNVAWTVDWALYLECCFKYGQYYDISVPLLDPQVGKSVVGPRTFAAVRELLWYNCSPVCGLSARQSTVGLMVTSSKRIYATCCTSQVCCSQSPSLCGRPLLTRASTRGAQTLKDRSGSVSCGKFLKSWEYQTTLPASWETCMQVKKQHLEPDMELVPNWEGMCQGCILSPCLFNLYAEYTMRNAGLEEAQAGIKIAGRNIKTSDMQMTPPLWQKVKRN